MLSRRGFIGCAICAIAGFAAVDAGAEVAQTPGLKRIAISRADGPVPGYETIEAKVEIAANAEVARHTHFGTEAAYVVEGSLTLTIEGQGTKIYPAGQGYQVPAGAIHGGKNGDAPVTLVVVYVVEKGKPLATPA